MNYGLLSGSSGQSFFLYYYAEYTGEIEFLDKWVNLLESSMDRANQKSFYHSYCAGIAGLSFLLTFFEKKNLLDSPIDEEINQYLFIELKNQLSKNLLDFLHGALGISYYFTKKGNDKIPLDEIVSYLQNNAIVDEGENNKIKWAIHGDKKNYYNISLSHGMSSIICILLKMYRVFDANNEIIHSLIVGGINYIIAQEIDKEKYGSYYPYTSIESEVELKGSRLSWCYGDLTIATTLYQAGQVLKRQDWINKAIEVLLYAATKRRNLKKNLVMDACFCHGTSGIGHIFYRMYWNTKLPEFKDAADYWFYETLKMAYHKDGLAGYKVWYTNGTWHNETNLLKGIAGVGLALLSYYYEIEPSWDECFLLS